MVKTLKQIFTFLVVGGLLFLAYTHFFPNNEKQIRKMLAGMASAACVPAKPSPVGAVMAIDRIQSCFAPNVQVNIEVPAVRRYTFADRDELMQVVKVAWANLRDVNVQFLDVNIELDASEENAVADLTLKVTPAGQSDFFFQELKMKLAKIEKNWRVTNVDSVQVLRK